MYPFKDRKPTKPNRKKITYEDDGTVKYATIEFADEPATEGTKLNRESLMSMQGIGSKKITFPSGYISKEVWENGITIETKSGTNSIIEIIRKDNDVTTITTTFNSDGSISEVVS